ncbi:MAG: hypothetical protein Q8M93_14530, partial [Polaromonas sp.]|uniref:hypothetical protein n=1 Tax=Polaromonas sp. TaxID=1869339 RepID=UPI0027370536
MTRYARHVSPHPNPNPNLFPHPSGWAEERSRKRIRASDCLRFYVFVNPACGGTNLVGSNTWLPFQT